VGNCDGYVLVPNYLNYRVAARDDLTAKTLIIKSKAESTIHRKFCMLLVVVDSIESRNRILKMVTTTKVSNVVNTNTKVINND